MRRVALALIVLAGCGSKREATADPASTPPPSFGGDAGAVGSKDGGDDDCAEEIKDIFVISEQSSLYSFHPPTLEFHEIGSLDCPTGGATPTSMAVDRSGIAWVRHSDGSLWKVSTRDLSCVATRYSAPAPSEPFFKFGMGFSTSGKGSKTEQLFLADNRGAGLARLDTSTFEVSFIGAFTGALAGRSAELTGAGDGKLYGFFVTEPAHVAEISKTNGDILWAQELPGVYAGDGWAFSFYGGDFYIYTSDPNSLGGSDVTRFRPKDGSVTVVKPKVGFKIVGAGVSTCAPTEGPR
jgi:hypothetical protein